MEVVKGGVKLNFCRTVCMQGRLQGRELAYVIGSNGQFRNSQPLNYFTRNNDTPRNISTFILLQSQT